MPELTPASLAIWVCILLAQPALVVVLVRSRVWRRWYPLVVFLAFSSLKSLVLACLFLSNASLLYFWIYWGSAAVSALLQLWVLRQVVASLLGDSGKLWQQRIFILLTTASLLIAAVAATHSKLPTLAGEMQAITDADRILSLAWCVLFFLVTVFADSLGLKWRDQSFRVATGFVCQATGEAAWSWLIRDRLWANLSLMTDVVYLIALAVWASAFLNRIATTADVTPSFNKTLDSMEAVHLRIRQAQKSL